MEQTGVRRIGKQTGRASTVVSAGAVALVLMGGPASAATAASSRPCPLPTSPADTLRYLRCKLGNLGDRDRPRADPKPRTKPKPRAASPAKPRSSNVGKPRKPRDDAPGKRPKKPRRGPADAGLRPYNPAPVGEVPVFNGALPAPQVVHGAQVPIGGPMLGDTRLITPVAAREPEQDHTAWVAFAAGAAGVVGAMNIGVLARRARRRGDS
ncbi:hypothetical protein [Thermomonospora umbrina]|uniref:MYXO-CTERM domain-containing protein n=1 Tax=Thermomonospora umbrina TaxID=111806 RepID=A0A3D9SYJ2_9ACTN|nr:hypothetical protein [Thermomonospora umbrina]REF01020.1 hypothetical protein DFJ69_6618 [Thermomonospora umbrina]